MTFFAESSIGNSPPPLFRCLANDTVQRLDGVGRIDRLSSVQRVIEQGVKILPMVTQDLLISGYLSSQRSANCRERAVLPLQCGWSVYLFKSAVTAL